MEKKVAAFQNKGMVRDTSISKASPEFAFENFNIRITARDHDTLLSVTNERGNSSISIENEESSSSLILMGNVLLGYSVLNEYLVLFMKDTNTGTDYIYRIKYDSLNDKWTGRLLIGDNLNFDVEYPIETLANYESEDVQKIYWVDGLNQPRLINISDKYIEEHNYSKDRLDFVTEFSSGVYMTVEKSFTGSGSFPSGTIQYLVTYSNQYGQETNVAYISPVYYISEGNSGSEANATVNCSFIINLYNLDSSYDTVNIYCIIRTSEYGTYSAYKVGEYSLDNYSAITITDTGSYSESLDPTSLLYVGGRAIIPYTMSQKDNTLFLGNIVLKGNVDTTSIEEVLAGYRDESGVSSLLEFVESDISHSIPAYSPINYYNYQVQLSSSSDSIRTFKCGEKYRFGCRFILGTGEKSAVLWIGDCYNYIPPRLDEGNLVYRKAAISFRIPADLAGTLYSLGFRQVELLMVIPTLQDRETVAQGFINPTLFNLEQRYSNAPFSLASWFLRPRNSTVVSRHYEQIPPNSMLSAEIQCINKYTTPYANVDELLDSTQTSEVYRSYTVTQWTGKGSNGTRPTVILYAYYEDDPNTAVQINSATGTKQWTQSVNAAHFIVDTLNSWGVPGTAINPTGASDEVEWWRQQVVNHRSAGSTSTVFTSDKWATSATGSNIGQIYSQDNHNDYFVDESVVSLYSPEISLDTKAQFDGHSLKFRIVGFSTITAVQTQYDVAASQGRNSGAGVVSFNLSSPNISTDAYGLLSFPYYTDTSPQGGDVLWCMYPWHKTGSIIAQVNEETNEQWSKLESKTIGNYRYSYNTNFRWHKTASGVQSYWEPDNGIYPIVVVDSDTESFIQFQADQQTYLYQQNYTKLLTMTRAADQQTAVPAGDDGYWVWYTGNLGPGASVEEIESGFGSSDSDNKDPAALSQVAISDRQYDGVDIAFKTAIHAVVSFIPVTDSGESFQVYLPDSYVGNEPVDMITNPNDSDLNPPGGTERPWFLPWKYSTNAETGLTSYDLILSSVGNTQFSGIYSSSSTFIITDDREYLKGALQRGGFIRINDSNRGQTYSGILNTFSIIRTPIYAPWNMVISRAEVSEPEEEGGNRTLSFIMTYSQSVNAQQTSIRINGASQQSSKTSPINVSINIPASSTGTLRYIFTMSSEPADSNNYTSSEWVSAGLITIDTNNWKAVVTQPEARPAEVITTTADYRVTIGSVTSKVLLVTSGTSYTYDPQTQEFTQVRINSFYYNDNRIDFGNDFPEGPYVFIAELYQDFSQNDTRYGGTDSYAVRSNVFTSLNTTAEIIGTQEIKVLGYSGDTYYQRWECPLVLPYEEGRENNIVDVFSVMLETYSNLDGLVTNNRGTSNVIYIDSDTFSNMNRVYSDFGTFNQSQVLDSRFTLSKYPTQITWTTTKTNTETVDSWTNITLASILDMDGDKGPVRAIRRFQNSLIAFQDKGIAEILFNSRTQLATTEGVPIEIGNSGRVDGKRYITDKAGCVNKWSIVETSRGIYFIDNINSSISIFNGPIQSLSDAKGFKDWIGRNNSTNLWNPRDFGNFVSYWDRVNDDVYFLKETGEDHNVLCFNEQLQQFVSFYDYGHVPMMTNVEDKFVSFRDGKLWLQGEGLYSHIFDEYQNFYTLYRVTPEPYSDKTFTNLTYRADMFDMNQNNDFMPGEGLFTGNTFDTLEVWNEYQGNKVNLRFAIKDSYPDKRRKFRIWRMDIPRDRKSDDNPYGLNRIRNPWIYLKLEKDNTNLEEGHNERMEFHDLAVSYFE